MSEYCTTRYQKLKHKKMLSLLRARLTQKHTNSRRGAVFFPLVVLCAHSEEFKGLGSVKGRLFAPRQETRDTYDSYDKYCGNLVRFPLGAVL